MTAMLCDNCGLVQLKETVNPDLLYLKYFYRSNVSDTMKKDFKSWHGKKESLHHEKERPFFHEREVWFCSLGVNIGFEQA